MANPMLIKMAIEAAADKENWKRLAVIAAAVFTAVALFLSLCFYVLTMPFQMLANFFTGDDYDKAKDLRTAQGYDLNIGVSTGEMMWVVDMQYNYISFGFFDRINPVTHVREHHRGIDIPAPLGSNVYAALDGVVTVAQFNSSYGNYIMLEHADGMTTLYAHNSALLKRVGDEVLQGEAIAKVGSTGTSAGNHSHFEVQIGGVLHDPLEFLSAPP